MAFDWKSALGTVAPTLATLIGGPLAGTAVGAITQALGLGGDADEKALARAVQNATPEQLLALKKADQDFAVRMKELDLEPEKVAAADRGGARDREARTGDSWTPRVLAAVVIGGFFGVVFAVLFGAVDNMKDPMTAAMVGSLIGYASAKADQVVGYYFGSSASSKAKDETIKSLSK